MAQSITLAAGVRRLGLLLVLALGLGGGAASAVAQSSPVAGSEGTPTASEGIAISGEVASPREVTLADLQLLPVETVEVTVAVLEEGGASETHTYTGVHLYDVLEWVGLAGDPADPESRVQLYVVLTARDGYQVVLSVGEIQPDLGDAPILLAWEEDGAPLPAEQAPAQLVVPGDGDDSRYIWAITEIDVRSVADETE
jgi:DMSO/TMAO reductase YedYZ molybdopterin-dependent catalytic subunit